MSTVHLAPPSDFKAPQGLLKYVILAYASRYPVTGAELAREVKSKTGGLWEPSPGSIYFLMNELKEKNLLLPIKDDRKGRKAYITTEEGRVDLARMAEGLLGGLQREITLLALLVSLVDAANAERMEFLKWALKAEPGHLAKLRSQSR
jgi:DNA-binding PadR family transcriptional regulator